MDEFALIRHYFGTAAAAPGVVLGVGDDGAILEPTPGCQVVMSLDTLVAGRHFPDDFPAADIGWRSLAVNLSDLAAMGADPRWCLLSLSLPTVERDWLNGFMDGFSALAQQAGIALVGGDTVRGPLSITVQVSGEVPRGQALRRQGAQPGDRICMVGCPGEAAAGLLAWQQGWREAPVVARFCRPQPQLELGRALRGRASACIDVSDGLLADLGHILTASAVGATLALTALPRSPALKDWQQRCGEVPLSLQLSGGDDYLLLFTLPPAQPLPDGAQVLGVIDAEPGLRLRDASGRLLPVLPQGWNHFSESDDD